MVARKEDENRYGTPGAPLFRACWQALEYGGVHILKAVHAILLLQVPSSLTQSQSSAAISVGQLLLGVLHMPMQEPQTFGHGTLTMVL